MIPLIVLTALSSWGYEGFCSEPTDDVRSSHSEEGRDHPDGPSPAPRTPPKVKPPAVEPARSEPATPPTAPAVTQVYAPPPPTVWRLADANGQVWEHPDPSWLRRWVDSRNNAMGATYRPSPRSFGPQIPAAYYCTGTRCYRAR
ncbi:MAG: hypothetical protein LC745_07230 [Planctomycetia bacterium]|nr:hypothetical protein [Planctomycetia bacterium]